MPISEFLLAKLKDKSLVSDKALVGNRWIASASTGLTFDVNNPSTGEVLATLPDLGELEVRSAIDDAYVAQIKWAKRTGKERAADLRKLYDLVVANCDDLATILTMEMGKPWQEAKGEILYGASYVEWFGEEAKRLYGDLIPSHQLDKRILVLKQPVGTVGAITPWNFPNAMLARKMAPAIAAGCSIVSKPAAQTPLSALALGVLAERAGLPLGLFSVLTATDAEMVGKEFTTNQKIRKLTFTGSTNVGKTLMRQGAEQVLKLSLELGGNAPFIVFEDANLDDAVEGAILSKYRNAGQTCVCANRLYVQDNIYDEFVAKLAERVRQMKVGDGFAEGTTIGPLIDSKALKKVQEHISDAVTKGAKIEVGGGPAKQGGLFFQPTILTGAATNMLLANEETFGPIAPLFKFSTEQEVIEMANNTEYGLASYFYSKDVSRIFRVAEALECGMVGVNTGLISTEVAPFGGTKQSGLGREGSRYGLDDYTEIKYVCLGV